MNTKNENGYLLIYSSDEWYKQLPADELQKLVESTRNWIDQLIAQGKARAGHALARQGAIISGKSLRVVSDGPFAESKEAIGGTLILDVATLDEAIAIARTSPNLRYNATIEVRPIIDECPLQSCLREKQAQLADANA